MFLAVIFLFCFFVLVGLTQLRDQARDANVICLGFKNHFAVLLFSLCFQVQQAQKNLARKPELDAAQRELQMMADELEMLKQT